MSHTQRKSNNNPVRGATNKQTKSMARHGMLSILSPTPDPVRARFASKDCCASSKMSGKQAARFRGSIWRLRRDTYRQGCPDRVCMAFAVSKKQERLVTFNRSQRNRGAFTSSIDSEKLSASSPAFRSSWMTCGPEQQTSHSSKRGTRKMPSGYYKMQKPGI
jgi:hypothetical protein